MINNSFLIFIRPFRLTCSGICGVHIQNPYATTTTFTLSARAEDKRVRFEAMPDQITLAKGAKGALCVRVQRKRPLLGLARRTNFTIEVKAADGQIQTLPGKLVYTPRIAFWHLLLVTFFVISFLLI